MTTIGQSFNAKSNNFDIIRLLAACLVVFSHSFSLLGHREPVAHWLGGYDTGGGWAVSIFFVISGFLIARSCLERSFPVYLGSRLARIIPALAVLVLFDVLIIGPLFTSLPIKEYFSSWQTISHLYSISIFFQQNGLPGVFDGSIVNGTIWTLPIEFACYILLPILYIASLMRRWTILIPLIIVAFLYIHSVRSGLDWANQGGEIFFGLPYFSTVKNTLFFMIGAAFWVHRNDIPVSRTIAVISFVLLIFGSFGYLKQPILYSSLSYLTIYMALAKHIPINLQKWPGDISYGIYLYGFPLQQAIIYSRLNGHIDPLTLSIVSLPITCVIAFMSWHLVEKPALYWIRNIRPTKKSITADARRA